MSFWGLTKVEWIQAISGIATLLAASAAWVSAILGKKTSETAVKQLDEMKKQRVEMYQPSLAFINNNYNIQIGDTVEPPNFYLYNIGFGAAKDVNIKWEEPDVIDYNVAPFFSEDKGLSFIRIMQPFNSNVSVVNKDLDYKQDIQYVLPTDIDKTPAKIYIPLIFTHSIIYRIYNDLVIKEIKTAIIVYRLNFIVNYKDINNASYKEKHQLEFGFSNYNQSEIFFYIRLD